MPAMRVVGGGHDLSEHANVRRDADAYVVKLDVSDFGVDELSVEVLGSMITVRGDQHELPGDRGKPFRIHERLEESFRLPDDADAARVTVTHSHRTLEIRAPRVRVEARSLPIEHAQQHILNPDAEPC